MRLAQVQLSSKLEGIRLLENLIKSLRCDFPKKQCVISQVWSKCGQDLLFVKVWTQMSLAQVLRFGMWKGQKKKPIWRKSIWLVEKIIFNNLKLISNDENPFKFNNFCFFSPKIVKQPLCMLSCWGLSDSTKSIVSGLKFWEG